jgi:hypothetical protein
MKAVSAQEDRDPLVAKTRPLKCMLTQTLLKIRRLGRAGFRSAARHAFAPPNDTRVVR